MKIITIDINIAKTVFAVHGVKEARTAFCRIKSEFLHVSRYRS